MSGVDKLTGGTVAVGRFWTTTCVVQAHALNSDAPLRAQSDGQSSVVLLRCFRATILFEHAPPVCTVEDACNSDEGLS